LQCVYACILSVSLSLGLSALLHISVLSFFYSTSRCALVNTKCFARYQGRPCSNIIPVCLHRLLVEPLFSASCCAWFCAPVLTVFGTGCPPFKFYVLLIPRSPHRWPTEPGAEAFIPACKPVYHSRHPTTSGHIAICSNVVTAPTCYGAVTAAAPFNGPAGNCMSLSASVGTDRSRPKCFSPLGKIHLDCLYTQPAPTAILLPPELFSQALRYPHPACRQSSPVTERNHLD
jgi:hypothetical protein